MTEKEEERLLFYGIYRLSFVLLFGEDSRTLQTIGQGRSVNCFSLLLYRILTCKSLVTQKLSRKRKKNWNEGNHEGFIENKFLK